MKCEDKLSRLIQDFFYERLGKQMQASSNTVEAYRTAIRMFLYFLQKKYGGELRFDMLCAENVVMFLEEYSQANHSLRSRNQRLAVLKSLSNYACFQYPEDTDFLKKISHIARRREIKKVVSFLECNEIKVLLSQPDTKTPEGLRDYGILSFMYNTGARVSEVTGLNISQLRLDGYGFALLKGKGQKERTIPLWKETVAILRKLTAGRENLSGAPVFLNRTGERLTRKGISYILDKAWLGAVTAMPPLKKKHISPHSIRHTTAMHLLQSGIDLNTIRLWLGHVSVETTNIYVEADLNMKREALSKAQMVVPAFSAKKWSPSKDILEFLENL